VADTIVSLIPAETGWRALYEGEFEEDSEMTRVVAWALMEDAEGQRRVEGLVVDPTESTNIVLAPDGVGLVATRFERYGFKSDL